MRVLYRYNRSCGLFGKLLRLFLMPGNRFMHGSGFAARRASAQRGIPLIRPQIELLASGAAEVLIPLLHYVRLCFARLIFTLTVKFIS